jgi:3-oxoacyl-ACP reductase-like protein
MPKRDEGGSKPQPKITPAPAKGAAKPAPAKSAAPSGAGKKIEKRSPLEERVKKFVTETDAKILDKVFEVQERVVSGEGGKTNMLFLTFSKDGAKDEKADVETGVGIIKELLFAYHTVPDTKRSGKELMMEVLPPAKKGDPYIACFQEVGAGD